MDFLEDKRKYTDSEEKILTEAKNIKEEYENIEKEIARLSLDDLRNRTKDHAEEIAKLNLKAKEMKSEVDDKMYKAAQVVGIFK